MTSYFEHLCSIMMKWQGWDYWGVCVRACVWTSVCHPVLSYIVKWSSYPSVRLPVADPLAICIFWGHRSAGEDEPTGANRAGVRPGQVRALPAASLAPLGPEKGGAAHLDPSSGTHFQITRIKSKSIISQVSSAGFSKCRLRGKKKKEVDVGALGKMKVRVEITLNTKQRLLFCVNWTCCSENTSSRSVSSFCSPQREREKGRKERGAEGEGGREGKGGRMKIDRRRHGRYVRACANWCVSPSTCVRKKRERARGKMEVVISSCDSAHERTRTRVHETRHRAAHVCVRVWGKKSFFVDQNNLRTKCCALQHLRVCFCTCYSESPNLHSTSKVRTFCLVFTRTVWGLKLVLRLRLETGLG